MNKTLATTLAVSRLRRTVADRIAIALYRLSRDRFIPTSEVREIARNFAKCLTSCGHVSAEVNHSLYILGVNTVSGSCVGILRGEAVEVTMENPQYNWFWKHFNKIKKPKPNEYELLILQLTVKQATYQGKQNQRGLARVESLYRHHQDTLEKMYQTQVKFNFPSKSYPTKWLQSMQEICARNIEQKLNRIKELRERKEHYEQLCG